jgi:hypothetical protein
MTDDQLYNAIWETVGKHVGYGVDCDVLTDQIWDIIIKDDAQTTRRHKRNQVGAFMMGTMWGRPQ